MRDYMELVNNLRCCNKDAACNGCTYFHDEEKCCEIDKESADAIEELLAKDTNAPNKWISVKDRLPMKYVVVLTANVYGGIQWNYLENSNWHKGVHITHWMPLPEAPKEVE